MIIHSRKLNDFIIYFFVAWPFIWENNQKFWIWDQKFRIFRFPGFFNMLDVFLIALVFLLILFNSKRKQIPPFKIYKLLIIAFSISLLSWFINGVFNGNIFSLDYLRTIAKYYRPFLIYIIVYNLSYNIPYLLKKVNRIFIIFAALNILIAWYQIIVYGAKGDLVTGFARGAHTLSIILLISSVFLFFKFIETKKIKFLVFFSLSFIPTIFASYGRAEFAMLLAISLFVLLKIKVKFKVMFSYSLVITIFLVFFVLMIKYYDPATYAKIEIAFSINLFDVPLIKSFIRIPFFLTENIKNIFFGFGPSQFGSGVHLESYKNAAGIITSPHLIEFYKYTKIPYSVSSFGLTSTMRIPSSNFIAILYENGIIVLFLFYYILYKFYRKTRDSILKFSKKYYIPNTLILLLLFFVVFSIILPDFKPFENSLFTIIFIYLALLHKEYDLLISRWWSRMPIS